MPNPLLKEGVGFEKEERSDESGEESQEKGKSICPQVLVLPTQQNFLFNPPHKPGNINIT